jgi:hypothetical protein
LGAYTVSVALDPAGNIYATSNLKPIDVWALPKANNSFTTPAVGKLDIQTTGLIQVKTVNLDKQVNVSAAGRNITLNADGLNIEAYTLNNVSGQVVRNGEVNAQQTEIPAAHLASGVYLLQVKTAQGTIVKKLIMSYKL